MDKTPKMIREEAAEAMQRFKRDEGALYRQDGEPKFGEVEMKERVRELKEARDGHLDSLREQAGEMAASWVSYAEGIREPDLASKLTDSELSRASSMYTFTSEEVASMGEEALGSRVKAVVKGGDKASMMCHARAIRKRANDEAARRRGAANTPAGRVAGGIPSSSLMELAERLEGKLEGNEVPKADRLKYADGKRGEYESAAFHVNGLRHPYRPNYSRPGSIAG